MRSIIFICSVLSVLAGCALPKELEVQPSEFHAVNPASRRPSDPHIVCVKSLSGKDVCKKRTVNKD